MRLSPLQKYILLTSASARRPRFPREELLHFYDALRAKPKADDQQNAVTKSLERLIDKGMLIGYGRRTTEKWFIDDIRLTPAGRRTAKQLLRQRQRSLPLHLKKSHQ